MTVGRIPVPVPVPVPVSHSGSGYGSSSPLSVVVGIFHSISTCISITLAMIILLLVAISGVIQDVWNYCWANGFSLPGLWTRIHGGWRDPPFQSVADFVEQSNHDHDHDKLQDDLNGDSGASNSHAHARLSLSTVRIITDDGYHLTLHHMTSSQPATRGPVLLQHGLLQTCLPFLLERDQSLAVYLARRGYDVWLGNNRGSMHSRSHATLSPSQAEYWHYSIDELALDVKANVTYIRDVTGQRVAYVGHSQGCSQALAALCTSPETREAIDVFIALAPGAFVRSFATQSLSLRFLDLLYRVSPRLFFFCFGSGSFIGFLEPLRAMTTSMGLMPVFGYVAFCVFKTAMTWGDDLWNKPRKNLYFRETPGGTSSRVLAHWIQQSSTSDFRQYDYGSHINMARYGTPTPPKYHVNQINTPTAVIYGGKDRLIDFQRLIQELGPNCKLSKCVSHHQHLDSLVAEDAHEVVYPDIVSFIQSQRA